MRWPQPQRRLNACALPLPPSHILIAKTQHGGERFDASAKFAASRLRWATPRRSTQRACAHGELLVTTQRLTSTPTHCLKRNRVTPPSTPNRQAPRRRGTMAKYSDLPRIGSQWTRPDDVRVYEVTLSEASWYGTGPKVILVEVNTGYPRIHTTPDAMFKHWTHVQP